MRGGGKMMRVLVVTGGIGSGKSEVCRILHEKGFVRQYNADQRAKQLYDEYPWLLEKIECASGRGLRDERGCFSPPLLAETIFRDPMVLRKVEELLFPVMKQDFESFASEAGPDEVVVFESATILEKPYFDGFGDCVLLVDAPREMRLARACRRDGATEEQVLARMDRQPLLNRISEGAECERADYVIVNDGSHAQLEQKVIDFLNDKIY